MNITKIIDNKTGANIISILWGLGLATIFRQACINRNCIIIKGPSISEIESNTYKFNNKCYEYKSHKTGCNH